MKRYLKWLAGVSLFIFITSTAAQQVKSLYRAEVPVLSQQPDARAEGLREALGEVLVKVSGHDDVLGNPK